MKIENEVTGEISERLNNIIRVDIYLRGEKIDNFEIYLNSESISLYLEHNTDKFLGVENTYEGYMQLIKDLGLEIPPTYKRHWAPKTGECYFYIDSEGEVCPNYFADFGCNEVDRRRRENFNMFPTRELAEKGKNLSKLGRLILLWQYANNCLFEPVWNNKRSRKHYFYYSHNLERILVGDYFDFQDDILYFETEEQTKAFVDMYSEEIKKIMGVR